VRHVVIEIQRHLVAPIAVVEAVMEYWPLAVILLSDEARDMVGLANGYSWGCFLCSKSITLNIAIRPAIRLLLIIIILWTMGD